jgi:hypothetical protein
MSCSQPTVWVVRLRLPWSVWTELKKAEEAQGFNRYMSNPETAFKTPQDYFAASRAAFAAGKDGTPLLNAGKALAKEQEVKTKRAKLVKSRVAGIKRNNKDMPEEVVSLVAEDDDIYQKWGATLLKLRKITMTFPIKPLMARELCDLLIKTQALL